MTLQNCLFGLGLAMFLVSVPQTSLPGESGLITKPSKYSVRRWGDERQAHRIATGRGAIGHGFPQGGVVLHVIQRGE